MLHFYGEIKNNCGDIKLEHKQDTFKIIQVDLCLTIINTTFFFYLKRKEKSQRGLKLHCSSFWNVKLFQSWCLGLHLV